MLLQIILIYTHASIAKKLKGKAVIMATEDEAQWVIGLL